MPVGPNPSESKTNENKNEQKSSVGPKVEEVD